MNYIQSIPTETGYYGNPHEPAVDGDYALPDELLPAYIDSMGFVNIEVEDGVVMSVTRNEEAYEAYIAEHPPQPEPEPQPTAEDTRDALLVDHELRITMLELGI